MTLKKDLEYLYTEFSSGNTSVLPELSQTIILRTQELVQKYKPYVNLKEDLEDIALNANESIIKTIVDGTFRGHSSINTYAYSIVRNKYVDYVRKESKNPLQKMPEGYDFASPLKMIDYQSLYQDCQVVLNKLSDDVQKLFDLRFVQGLSYEDIAKELNTSTNAIHVKTHRLKETLKKNLQGKTYGLY